MRVVKSVPVEDFEFRGSIKDSDVTRMIRAFAVDPHIHGNEAEALLRLNRTCPIQAPSWSGFLVEVIGDYILNQSGPEGYITTEKSTWLIGKLSSDGWIANRAEFDLLLSILGRARWFPLSLATFALDQVAGAVIHGYGPLRSGLGHGQIGVVPGSIGDAEVALLRVILNAFGGDSSLALTRAEMEILIGVNKAIGGRPVPSAWTDLFAKAIANVVLSEHGYSVPPRSVALRPLVSTEPSATLEERVAGTLGMLRHDYHRQSLEERALARLERQRIEIVTGEAIAADEKGWLSEQLFSRLSRAPIETAVLDHLSRECLIGQDWESRKSERSGRAA
jgi:hypothetical protein